MDFTKSTIFNIFNCGDKFLRWAVFRWLNNRSNKKIYRFSLLKERNSSASPKSAFDYVRMGIKNLSNKLSFDSKSCSLRSHSRDSRHRFPKSDSFRGEWEEETWSLVQESSTHQFRRELNDFDVTELKLTEAVSHIIDQRSCQVEKLFWNQLRWNKSVRPNSTWRDTHESSRLTFEAVQMGIIQ